MNKFLLGITLILGLASCDKLKPNPIELHIKGHSGHSLLLIKNFKWSYGKIEVNKFSGDFETLDRMVFDSLKGRYGDCIVSIQDKELNKYGSLDSSKIEFGFIKLDELNKYQSAEYWHKDGGIAKMLYKHFSQSQTDSARIDTVVQPIVTPAPLHDTTMRTTIVSPETSGHITYKITYDELYPRMKPNTDPATRLIVNGIISSVYYDLGQISVITKDDETIAINFFTADVSKATAEKMAKAFQVGNTIRCVCFNSANDGYLFLAAKVTSEEGIKM